MMAKTSRRRRKIEDAWADLTEESVRCRIGGHRWRPYDAQRVVGAFETDEVCERCASHRLSTISNRGEVRSRQIKYSDGYLHEGQGRFESSEKDSMRLSVLMWDYKL